MEIINNLFIFGLLKRVSCQNKGYDSPSVNIEMGGGVILGLPIMHCSYPNINLSFLRININNSTSYCLEVCKYVYKSGLFMSEYVRA